MLLLERPLDNYQAYNNHAIIKRALPLSHT